MQLLWSSLGTSFGRSIPRASGSSMASITSAALLGSVGFASIDGPAAVMLFFVLSGFVLPLGFFRGGNTDSCGARCHQTMVAPRLPRPARGAVLLSAVPLRPLLASRGGTVQPSPRGSVRSEAHIRAQEFRPSLTGALLEGSLFAFLREPDMYDPVLWTMHHEFIGSFVTFFLAILLWRARPMAAIWLLTTAAVVVHFTDPYADRFCRRHRPGLGHVALCGLQLSLGFALCCVAAGIFLFGYLEPCGSYAAFAALRDPSPVRLDRIAIHTASGLLIIHRPGWQRQARSVPGECALSAARPPVISSVSVPLSTALLACLRAVRCAATDMSRIPGDLARRSSNIPAAGHRRWLSAVPRGRYLVAAGSTRSWHG